MPKSRLRTRSLRMQPLPRREGVLRMQGQAVERQHVPRVPVYPYERRSNSGSARAHSCATTAIQSASDSDHSNDGAVLGATTTASMPAQLSELQHPDKPTRDGGGEEIDAARWGQMVAQRFELMVASALADDLRQAPTNPPADQGARVASDAELQPEAQGSDDTGGSGRAGDSSA